jgi:hypothetical protein
MLLEIPIENLTSSQALRLWSSLYKAKTDLGWSTTPETTKFFGPLFEALKKQEREGKK